MTQRILLFVLISLTAACSRQSSAPDSLRVYVHDSFVGKRALGPFLKEEFERSCKAALEWVVAGDAGQILQRLDVDRARGKSSAHVALGFDQLQWKSFAPFMDTLTVDEVARILPRSMRREAAAVSARDGFIPYDFGAFGWIADLEALQAQKLTVPRSWKELAAPAWKRKLLLQDPRTSTPGFAALLTLRELQGKDALGFWKKLRASWLTLAPGWDEAYGLFLEGKAPLVWSYVTSEAYHRSEGSERYRALVLDDASVLQVEGAGVLKGSQGKDRERALCFLGVLLSQNVQAAVPERQWMWPVRQDVALPKSYQGLAQPKRFFQPQPSREERVQWLDEWRAAL